MTVTLYIGAKGGVGCTAIAISAARAVPGSLLIDLDLAAGDVDLRCGIEHTVSSLADLIALSPTAIASNPECLTSILYRASGNLEVAPSPAQPELAEALSPDHIREIVLAGSARSRNVVIDGGSRLDVAVLAAAMQADTVVIVASRNPASLRAGRALDDVLRRAGVQARCCATSARRRHVEVVASAVGLPAWSAPRAAKQSAPVLRLRRAVRNA